MKKYPNRSALLLFLYGSFFRGFLRRNLPLQLTKIHYSGALEYRVT
jgi:hypothetical protein